MIHEIVALALIFAASRPTDADILFAFAQEDSIASFGEAEGTGAIQYGERFDGDTLHAIRALADGLYSSRVLAWRHIDSLGEVEKAALAAWMSRSPKPALADAGRRLARHAFRCRHCRGAGRCPTQFYCHECSRGAWLDPDEYGPDPCRACGATGVRPRSPADDNR